MKSLLTILFLISSFASFAADINRQNSNDIPPHINRIKGRDAPKENRCPNQNIPPEICIARRDKALKRSCINQQEFNSLVEYDDVPVCDYDEPTPMYRLIGQCPCGCLPEDANILVSFKGDRSQEYLPAKELYENSSLYNLWTLSDSSTLANIDLTTRPIGKKTTGHEARDLYTFHTEKGSLTVTRKHGILLSTGHMIYAMDVTTNHKLVAVDGEAVQIHSIEKTRPEGRVYNFKSATPDYNKVSHTMVVDDFIIGDLAWQNNLETALGEIAVRQK